MKNNLSELQKAKIIHATTTVVAGLLFVLCISKEMFLLAVIFAFLFIVGISLYK